MEYARWLDAHQRHINNLRVAVIADMGDDDDDRPRFLTGSPKLLELNWPCVQPTIGTNV